MKEITKEIRKEVKRVIEEVGGTANLLNMHVTSITEKFLGKNYIVFDEYKDKILTTIHNQIYYFKFRKGL